MGRCLVWWNPRSQRDSSQIRHTRLSDGVRLTQESSRTKYVLHFELHKPEIRTRGELVDNKHQRNARDSRALESPAHIFAHGQGSAWTRCIAAWMSCCDSESLTHTTLKRDLLPACSTQSRSPGRTCRVMPESKAPLSLTLLATASCANG